MRVLENKIILCILYDWPMTDRTFVIAIKKLLRLKTCHWLKSLHMLCLHTQVMKNTTQYIDCVYHLDRLKVKTRYSERRTRKQHQILLENARSLTFALTIVGAIPHNHIAFKYIWHTILFSVYYNTYTTY